MSAKSLTDRIIFGLKVKQARLERGLSFQELAAGTGMSVSYLNEIEKGKKYPKADKIRLLAEALGTTEAELCSPELKAHLAPVEQLLRSNFLNELPLDLFGIELPKVVEIIANAPARVGAFISTLVELARNYAVRQEHFYFASLRAYLELHSNYFPEIEKEVDAFIERYGVPTATRVPVALLRELLEREYGYTIVDNGLDAWPELAQIRSVFLPRTRRLLLNRNLTETQKAFQLGKELGFNYLNLTERAYTASLLRVRSFEEVISHFKAGYFSAALLINRPSFLADLEHFFGQPRWNPDILLGLLDRYGASPEMLVQRMTNLLPSHFGIEKLFALRITQTPSKSSYRVDKELYLNYAHRLHSNERFEHYCRRWRSISVLEALHRQQAANGISHVIADAQRSTFVASGDEYLSITIARSGYPTPDRNVSMTLGLLVDESLEGKVAFLDDPAIGRREVNITCERCALSDCAERAAPPVEVEKKLARRRIQEILRQLIEEEE